MKNQIILSLLILLLIPFVSAQTVEGEISELIGYAEQYELGNIDYLELLIHASISRDKVNEILGSFNEEEYGPSGITADAAEQYFGIPKGYTKQAWSSSSDEDIRLEEEVPWFEKILFDGKRIQMTFHAWPHVYDTDGEQTVYYWTDFQVRYKKELTLNLDDALAQIESSGRSYLDGTGSAEETTALIIIAQREVQQYIEQNKENCESVMNDLFPAGSLQRNEKSERWNIDFFEGEDMEVTLVVSLPDCAESCQWPWINIWFDPRSSEPIYFSGWSGSGEYTRESFSEYTIEQLEGEFATTLEELKSQMQRIDDGEADWSSLQSNQGKLQALNEALGESYYNRDGFDQNDKEEFEQRKSNLQNIVENFGSIDTESVQEKRYEQRLVTNSMEHQDAWCQNTNEENCNTQEEACIAGACTYALGGNEDCGNAIDDDGDTVADCSDPDCAKSCGTFCQNVCSAECGDCKNTCYDSSCKECWNCDWEANNAYCNELCESSGCNTCSQNCREQSFCAECTACEDAIYAQPIDDCTEACSPCTECRALYESTEEADASCANTCDPCTICKAPSVNAACYEACDEISSGGEKETCYSLCDDKVLFVCNGQMQLSPCLDTTYICEGTQQPFPCTVYSCPTEAGIQKQTVACGQEICGKHQVLDGSICTCEEGFYDCDTDGSCTDTSACGVEQEICDDGLDNDEDFLFDCQDISACETQSCGENNFCQEGLCVAKEELSVCLEGELLENGICRKTCSFQEECTAEEFCSYGYCSIKKSCLTSEECFADESCENGFCEQIQTEQDLLETGESCTLESDCAGERDICSNGVCKEIPKENYDALIDEGLLTQELEQDLLSLEVREQIDNIPTIIEEPILESPEQENQEEQDIIVDSITGFVLWASSAKVMTGMDISESTCSTDADCGENQGCDTWRGECYCQDLFFDCNNDESDGCESSDATCDGTREMCVGGCGLNQYCDEQRGSCQCNEGFSNCDGLWWDCESEKTECAPCTSNEDCADASCAPWGGATVLTFGCFKGSTWTEDKGALSFSGGCTSFSDGQVQPWLNFDSWGEPFDEINQYRNEMEENLGSSWCLEEKENALRQRAEIEHSLNDQEFVENLFAQLLTEDTDEWETHREAIYSMYWSIVDNIRQLARSSQCLGEDYPALTPLELSYEFEAGSIELYEETTYAEEFEMDVLTPYMKLGIFPPKELVKEELKKAAQEGHFPGDNEEQAGPSAEELEEIRSDPGAMEYIKELTSEYEDGSLDAKITIVDQQESIFIVDFSISQENLFQVKPVANYEKEADITVEVEFDFLYDFISNEERDGRLEHPEWVEDSLQEDIADVVDAGLTIAKITTALATGDISITPLSKVSTAVELLGHMFGGE